MALSLMTWNWQRPDWPSFSWDHARFRKAEERFLVGSSMFACRVKHLGSLDQERLAIEALSTGALTTSEIEGEIPDRASVQSSIRRQLGLAGDNRRVKPAEQGIAELVVDLYRSFAEPLSDDTSFAWHRMPVKGCGDRKDIGRYRTTGRRVRSSSVKSPAVIKEPPRNRKPGRKLAERS